MYFYHSKNNRFLSLVFFFVSAIAGQHCYAAQVELEQEIKSISVTVHHRPIMEMRTAPDGVSLTERAKAAEQRILKLISDKLITPIEKKAVPEGIQLTVAGRHVLFVRSGDLNPTESDTIETLAEKVCSNMRLVFQEVEESSNPEILLHAALKTLAALIVLLGLIFLTKKIAEFLIGKAQPLAGKVSDRLQLQNLRKTHAELKRAIQWLAKILFLCTSLVFTYVFTTFSMRQFPQTRAFSESLGGFLLKTISAVGKNFLNWIPGIITVVCIVIVTKIILKFAGEFFDAIEEGKIDFNLIPIETVKPTRQLTSMILWVFALVMAYPYLPGSDTDAFKGISVFLGLVLSVGSTGVLGQVMGGLHLMYSRSIAVGDFVKIKDVQGTVTTLGFLSLKLRTQLGEEVAIPNTVVLSNMITNFSKFHKIQELRLATTVTIGYDVPWRKVYQMLIEAAKKTEGLASEPTPEINQSQLSDFYVEYKLKVYLKSEPREKFKVLSSLHENIQDEFNTHGYQIMSPHYEADPSEPKVVAPQNWG